MESARCPPPQPKIPSPSQSAASKGEQQVPPQNGEATKMQSGTAEHNETPIVQQTVSGKGKVTKAPDVSEATYDSRSMMEPASQGSARPIDDEVQQKQVPAEAGKEFKIHLLNKIVSVLNMITEVIFLHYRCNFCTHYCSTQLTCSLIQLIY